MESIFRPSKNHYDMKKRLFLASVSILLAFACGKDSSPAKNNEKQQNIVTTRDASFSLSTVVFLGSFDADFDYSGCTYGIIYSDTDETLSEGTSTKVLCSEVGKTGYFSITVQDDSDFGKVWYFKAWADTGDEYFEGEIIRAEKPQPKATVRWTHQYAEYIQVSLSLNYSGLSPALVRIYYTDEESKNAGEVEASGNYKKFDLTGSQSAEFTIGDLKPNTTYYCVAAVEVGWTLFLGDLFNSKTAGAPVDLGLSVKWSPDNLGVTSSSDHGDLYAWGETEPKTEFTKDNYTFTGSEIGLSRDPAHRKWGGKWRMPTLAEVEELLTLSWSYTGASGWGTWTVTSHATSKSIKFSYNSTHSGSDHYWTSTLYVPDTPEKEAVYKNNYAHSLAVTNGTHYEQIYERWNGLYIRPVWDDNMQ